MTSTSEVLNRAADLIEERGWTRGNGGWEADGGPLCLEGAILAVIGHDAAEARPWYYSRGACPAYDAVCDHIGHDSEEGKAWAWNDDRDSAAEVIEVLRAAAVIEAARESADEPALTEAAAS